MKTACLVLRRAIPRAPAVSCAVVVLAGCTAVGAVDDGPIDTLASYRMARDVLDAGIDALGGADALTAIQHTDVSYAGVTRSRGQSANPSATFDELPVEGRFVYEEGGRVFLESKGRFRGGVTFHTLQAIDADSGYVYNVPNEQLTALTAFEIGLLKGSGSGYAPRAVPHTLVNLARARVGSLRWIGETREAGRTLQRIAFSDGDGTPLTLVMDADSHLPLRMETLGSDPIHGDAVFDVRFDDYRSVGGVQVPHTFRFATAGEVLTEWTAHDVVLNGNIPDDRFLPPSGVPVTAYQPGFTPQRLAPGVYAMHLWSGFGTSYNIMFAEFADHVVVIEAPLVNGIAPVVQRVVQGVVGESKPIRYVVSTHYHADHTGGIGGYLAAGATAVTTAHAAARIEAMAAARHTLGPNGLDGRPPAIETVESRRTLTDGSLTLELIKVGPTPHVDELVLAYFPAEKALYVGDHFGPPLNGHHTAPTESLEFLDRTLRELGLEVETYVPTHGAPASAEEFARALAR